MGLIYEVNITVSSEIATPYRKWLKVHVERMLQIPTFTKARICQVTEPAPSAGTTCFCIHYEVQDLPSLERYFATDAPRMRAEADVHFAGKYSAQRRWMEVLG